MTTTPEHRVVYMPITKEEERARGYDTLKYGAIANRLHSNGWRKQERAMVFAGHDDGQRAEWWNKGQKALLVAVIDTDTCILFRPTRVRAALNVIGNKEGKV